MPWQAMTQKALEFCATEIQAETIVEEVHYRRQRAPAPEAGIENPTYYDHPKSRSIMRAQLSLPPESSGLDRDRLPTARDPGIISISSPLDFLLSSRLTFVEYGPRPRGK